MNPAAKFSPLNPWLTKAISISVVSTPDGAVIDLDGEPRGYAPISVDNVSEGEHIITISSPGFVEKTVKAKTVKGHKLIVSVQLARESAAVEPEPETKEATPSATPKVSPKISPALLVHLKLPLLLNLPLKPVQPATLPGPMSRSLKILVGQELELEREQILKR